MDQSNSRETFLSTGGDYGVPGLQVYRDGPILGAILSTGEDTWEVRVMGNLPKNNSWSNIGIRWEPLKFSDVDTYNVAKTEAGGDLSKLGGLQILLNLEMIGHSLLPMNECPQNSWTTCIDGSSGLPEPEVKESFAEGTMIVGCHKTKDNAALRQFSGGIFDEVAFWNKRIPDEEKHMMLGGWKESFDQVSTDELVSMMDNVDFSDPAQAAVALQLLQSAVTAEETTQPEFRDIYPTEATTTAETSATEEGEDDGNSTAEETTTVKATTTLKPVRQPEQTPEMKKEAFVSFINVMNKLSNPDNVPGDLSQTEFESKIEVSRVIGEFLNMNGKNHDKWEMVNEDPNIPGAHEVRQTLEMFVTKAIQNRVLAPSELYTRAEVQSDNSFVQYEKIANPEVLRRQVYDEETFVFPMWRKRAKRAANDGYSPYVLGDTMDKWHNIADSIEIPLMLFSGKCAEQDIAFVGNIYENFPDPGRKDPVNIFSNKIKVDSRVMTVNVVSNKWDRNMEEFSAPCQPDPKLLYRKKLLVNLETKDKAKSKRQLLFHENDEKTTVVRRHCAMWNTEIGLHGAWDTVDIETKAIDENSATCVTDKLGTYAIVAELVELPHDFEEPGWLAASRLVGYILSTVLLVIFVIIIFMSAYLWEQFHVLRLNLSMSLIIGNIAVLLGEMEFIQVHLQYIQVHYRSIQ